MSRFLHITLQGLLVAGNAAVAASKAISAPYSYIVIGGMSAAQAVIALVNHAKGK